MFKFLNKKYKTIKRSYSNLYKFVEISNVHCNNEMKENITIKGWVKALRKLKENIFVDVTDGSCSERLQVFLPASEKPPNLTTGSSIIASGYLSKNPKGQHELVANNVTVVGECVFSEGYPFAPRKTYPPEYIRQYLHFRPRTNKFAAVLRIRHTATKAIHDYFHEEGFFQIHTPILTSNDCEGAGEVFTVQPQNKTLLKEMSKEGTQEDESYFNSKAFLTVSGQLHLEAAAYGLSKVYTFGPTFRAENSKSRLHLSEFYMVEAETAFLENLQDVMDQTEKLLKKSTNEVLNKCNKDISLFNESLCTNWLQKSFTILTYNEAIKLIENKFGPVNKLDGLSKEHELFLVDYCQNLVFIIDWPKNLKSFYMKQSSDSSKVFAFDLLGPIVGEIVGGSLREDNYELLKQRVPINKPELNWYLELRKFGGVPTGGFGLGFERFLQMFLGISNIKDTIPFPRWPHNCSM